MELKSLIVTSPRRQGGTWSAASGSGYCPSQVRSLGAPPHCYPGNKCVPRVTRWGQEAVQGRAAQMLGSGGEAGDTVCLSRRETAGGPERMVPANIDFRILPPGIHRYLTLELIHGMK